MSEERFNELYREHSAYIATFLTHLCGDPELASDLAQETFLNIHRYLNTFSEEKASFRTWAVRIARNVYYRHRSRKQNRLDTVEGGEEIEDRSSHQANVEGELVQKQIYESIDRLPEPERSVIILKQVQRRSLSETARLLRLSERTISRKLKNALLLLDEALRRKGIFLES